MKGKKALVVVDLQRDFCPGGKLAVRGGDEIIEVVNELAASFCAKGLPTVFTRDWHPRNHCSFKPRGGMWPVHCVQNTPGAEFHPALLLPDNALIVSKGTRPELEAYSGFDGTSLADQLLELGASELYVAGLATDYCVKNTVLDALRNGFTTYVLVDCVRGVNMKRVDSANAFRSMTSVGARKCTSKDLMRQMDRRVAVSSSS